MSILENKQLAIRFFETLHKPDVDGAFDLMSPDAVCWVPTDKPGGAVMSVEEVEEVRKGAHACFRLFERRPVVKPRLVAAEGNLVCLELTSRGGLTRGGASYKNDYFVWLRIDDGRIVEFREYVNPLLAAGLVKELQTRA